MCLREKRQPRKNPESHQAPPVIASNNKKAKSELDAIFAALTTTMVISYYVKFGKNFARDIALDWSIQFLPQYCILLLLAMGNTIRTVCDLHWRVFPKMSGFVTNANRLTILKSWLHPFLTPTYPDSAKLCGRREVLDMDGGQLAYTTLVWLWEKHAFKQPRVWERSIWFTFLNASRLPLKFKKVNQMLLSQTLGCSLLDLLLCR